MDEAKIREIVRDELAAARKAPMTEPAQAMVAALERFDGTEITVAALAALAGITDGSRRVAVVAGLVLRELGWSVAYRRGGGARERVYARRTVRAA